MIASKYLHNLALVQVATETIETDFEFLKETGNKDQHKLNQTMERIKYNKNLISQDRAEINTVLSTMSTYNISDKIYLEFARIMYNSYDDALNQIGFELLAQQAGVYEFKETYVSETLNTEMGFLKEQFNRLIKTLEDVDNRITSIMKHTQPALDLYNELRLLSELEKGINDASNFKVKIYQAYVGELDVANRANKELSLLQKAEVDSHIVMSNWIIQFMRTYQTLVQRLVGQSF